MDTTADPTKRYRRTRPRGSEIRRLIAELKQLTRAADRLPIEGADSAAVSANRIDTERKQSQLAEAVRRDPTFGRAGPRAASPRRRITGR